MKEFLEYKGQIGRNRDEVVVLTERQFRFIHYSKYVVHALMVCIVVPLVRLSATLMCGTHYFTLGATPKPNVIVTGRNPGRLGAASEQRVRETESYWG